MPTRALLPNPIFALGVILTGCATTPDGARPDDMSAAEHDKHAAAHAAQSREHREQHDPSVTRMPAASPNRLPFDDFEYIRNPTDHHLAHAERHAEHAAAHHAAAEALLAFEDEQCGPIAPTVRPRCPLLGTVDAVHDIKDGVRLMLAEGVDSSGLVAHMKCHFAFGRAQAFDAMPDCPLYQKGLSVSVAADGRALEIRTSDASQITELQRRAHTHAD